MTRYEVHVRKISAFVILAASAALLGACDRSTHDETATVRPVPVSTARVAAASLTSPLEAGGVVRARSTAVVSSRLLAPVIAVNVRAGDRVKRGAALVILDAREVAANRARASASFTSAADAVLAAESDVRSAGSVLSLAGATHDRIRTLHDRRSATTQELDQAASAFETADAQFAQAEARLSATKAAKDAARAADEAAAVAVSYTTLSSPFDGIVTERSVDPGSMAIPGAALVTVEDVTLFRLETSLDQSRAANVRVGDSVAIQLGDGEFPDSLNGRVSEIARLDPASHSSLVKVDLPSVNGLRSGLFGRALFAGPTRKSLVVPSSAAIRRGQLIFVFTIDRDNRARLRAVSPGASTGDRLEILAGLDENDVVVTNPPSTLTDGAPVAGARR